MAFILTQTLKNLNCLELPCTGYFSSFLKRNSFKKARKQVVTTKLFMNVHFCSLGMKTYRFHVVKSQVTLQEQLLSLKSLSNKTGLECF